LNLIRDLGLEIITSPPQKRYLFHRGRLRSLASFLPGLIPYLIREPFISAATCEDESIYDFAARRFSPKIAETLFDPRTLGIYAGDIRKLSIRACFPTLYQWEREKGSLFRGLLSAPKKAKGLFTIRNGMDTLIAELQKRLPIEIVLNCKVESIRDREVLAGGKHWQADRVISALPPPFPAKSIWVVHLAYEGNLLSKKGFGYLVPTQEKENVLGVVFDSSIFPQQNSCGETRLTAMLRAQEPLQATLRALERHLGITAQPIFSSSYLAQEAIPQLEVGCNYFGGISLEACITKVLSPTAFSSSD
jgi:oxygen-dependent protoporphyrinogen oxidase